MNNDKITELIKQLDGISYSEWFKLKYLVETYFSQKKNELEREIKLSSENALLSAKATGVLTNNSFGVKTVLLSQEQSAAEVQNTSNERS